MFHLPRSGAARVALQLRRGASPLVLGLCLLVAPQLALAADSADSPVATVNGEPVLLSELEARAGDSLSRLEMQRRQILEDTLAGLVDERVVTAEAERQGTTVNELLEKELGGKLEVDAGEVDAWYSQNQARIRQPKEAVAEQIHQMLVSQRRAQAQQQLVSRLRAEHQVEILLEPYRVDLGSSDTSVPFEGAAGAPVEVVLFSDFQCPFCRNVAPAADELAEKFGTNLKISFRHLPLESIHPRAKRAGELAACAQKQNKFWPMHDAIFERFGELEEEQLFEMAKTAGLDSKQLDRCLQEGDGLKDVERDMALAQKHGITGTPSIFVNGRPVMLKRGSTPADQISAVVADELRRSKR